MEMKDATTLKPLAHERNSLTYVKSHEFTHDT